MRQPEIAFEKIEYDTACHLEEYDVSARINSEGVGLLRTTLETALSGGKEAGWAKFQATAFESPEGVCVATNTLDRFYPVDEPQQIISWAIDTFIKRHTPGVDVLQTLHDDGVKVDEKNGYLEYSTLANYGLYGFILVTGFMASPDWK